MPPTVVLETPPIAPGSFCAAVVVVSAADVDGVVSGGVTAEFETDVVP